MATEAARLRAKDPHLRKNKTVLTLTGLLMEGLGSDPKTMVIIAQAICPSPKSS
jgi:hypothetical protein